ncbi:MAG: riboflavin kinase [Candidatus Kerfeldbacteria bacterium]|nr:riboflavin kinase [Candidatus Kerfeldbacteria bacterium]
MADIVKGLVIAGLGEGRKLGYPTANLKLTPDSFRPTPGVYLATVKGLGKSSLYGLLISGVHQEASKEPRVEVYVIDWQTDIYGQNLIVEVGDKIRDLVFTNDATELKKLIEQDIIAGRQYFKGNIL